MFSALELESGRHSVELKYKTPYLNYGIAVSCAGVLAMLGMIVFTEVKGKNSKGKRTREV